MQIVAFKAYLRTNTGNHKAVSARAAARYFGPVPPGKKSPRCACFWHATGVLSRAEECHTIPCCRLSQIIAVPKSRHAAGTKQLASRSSLEKQQPAQLWSRAGAVSTAPPICTT